MLLQTAILTVIFLGVLVCLGAEYMTIRIAAFKDGVYNKVYSVDFYKYRFQKRIYEVNYFRGVLLREEIRMQSELYNNDDD
jgi:hypothetical protein